MFDVDSLLKEAIAHYGEDLQLDVAIEEMSELTKEIVKHKRGADNRLEIVEEISDVLIMIGQLQIIFGIDNDEIAEVGELKLTRLKRRLEAERNENNKCN